MTHFTSTSKAFQLVDIVKTLPGLSFWTKLRRMAAEGINNKRRTSPRRRTKAPNKCPSMSTISTRTRESAFICATFLAVAKTKNLSFGISSLGVWRAMVQRNWWLQFRAEFFKSYFNRCKAVTRLGSHRSNNWKSISKPTILAFPVSITDGAGSINSYGRTNDRSEGSVGSSTLAKRSVLDGIGTMAKVDIATHEVTINV